MPISPGPISPGQKLGPYEIVELIGEGGMGQVWKASDSRLGRLVAVKVISEVSPEHRQRFAAEAHAVASLNHPHICTLYDVGLHEGVDYLVMELIHGQSLAARISRGPIPPDEAVRFAVEIASGLDAAHAAGVVHRDLKPGNIMLTRTGAKILDFGLARRLPGPHSGADETMTMALTVQGVASGTLPYMAPEQLEGNAAEPVSDIFAFGAILYEMVTGKRAFFGTSQASVIHEIMHRPGETLDYSACRPFEPIIRSCLVSCRS